MYIFHLTVPISCNLWTLACSPWLKNNINDIPRFKVGDRVRTRIMKGKFDSEASNTWRKGTKPKFSSEIYTIKSIEYDSVYFYVLNNDKWYYEEELIKVS